MHYIACMRDCHTNHVHTGVTPLLVLVCARGRPETSKHTIQLSKCVWLPHTLGGHCVENASCLKHEHKCAMHSWGLMQISYYAGSGTLSGMQCHAVVYV